MVEQLAHARKKLVERSCESGIAEMASGTLHNVRNALTPVLVELDMPRQELAKAPIDQIDMAKKQLSEESVPDARRQDLTKFLDLASGRLAAVTRETHAKLGEVTGRAKQIEQFLSDQESASRADRPMEWVALNDLIKEAAALLPANLRERLSIEAGAGVTELGSLKTHRVCLLQIFNNLFTNAAEAIGVAGETRGSVVVDASEEDMSGTHIVHLRVSDDGVGISPEEISRIFERGFTTKGNRTKRFSLKDVAGIMNGCSAAMPSTRAGSGKPPA